METEYKKLYLMVAKHNPFPANCMPISERNRHNENLKKLLDINRTIAGIVNTDGKGSERAKRSESQNIHFDQKSQESHASTKRIHNILTHYSTILNTKTVNAKSPSDDRQHSQSKYETLQPKGIERRKDLYDNQIEKYMTTKYESDEIIDKYLTNRQKFIQEACMEIQKELKQEYHLNKKTSRSKSKTYKSALPKIEQYSSHMIRKPTHRPNEAVYLQQLTQLKKLEQLQLKNRRRNLRFFHRKMDSLQARMNQLKNASDD